MKINPLILVLKKIRGREAAAQIANYMEYDKWVPAQGLVIPPLTNTP